MFCSVMQNLYNSTGTIPISEQAKKPFSTLIARCLYSRPAVLVFDGGIKNSNHRSGNKERPAEQSKQLNGCLHPIQFKDIRTHVAYHCKEISYCFVNGFIEPLDMGIPNGWIPAFRESQRHRRWRHRYLPIISPNQSNKRSPPIGLPMKLGRPVCWIRELTRYTAVQSA